MSSWSDYKREEREKIEGNTRCVITDVEETVSKSSGLPMIIVTVRPSGSKANIRWYLVKNDNFNKNATQFFDAVVGVDDGDFEFVKWVGCEIGANLGEDDKGYLTVKWWISRNKLEKLPEFVGEKPPKLEVTSLTEDDSDDDLPFDI